MPNLKLPNLSHASLTAILSDLKLKRTRLAYATWAALNADGSVSVTHHDSIIAVIDQDSVALNSHGWDSMTTAQRMDRVLRDNGYSERISIRQGELTLLDGDTLKPRHKGIRNVTARTSGDTRTVQSYA